MDTTDFTKYNKNLAGIIMILVGTFMLIEHIWTWSEVAFFDFIGHEWFGIILIAIGMLINTNWSKERLSSELK